MTDDVALQISGLQMGFGVPVLQGVDLSVVAGRLTAILGASGSGKTTLLRLIAGFERPDAGTITLHGQAMAGPGLFVATEKRHVGYVAQDGALFPHLSVADNILFGLPRRIRRGAAGAVRAADLLRLVGLPLGYAARPPQQLSGGEQQRVALARALAPSPRLVLLDEPFSALDAALRVETRRAVADALQAVGATAILVTHDQSEALSMGHEVAVLRAGRLVQVASPTELYQHPVDPELARFVGEAVLLEGMAVGRVVHCALGELSCDSVGASGIVDVLVRPEQIRLHSADRSPLRGTVAEVTYYGHDASVRLTMNTPGLASLTARVSGHAVPGVGERCGITIEGDVVAYNR